MIEDAPWQQEIKGRLTPSWVQWLTKIRLYAGSVSESGTTANRPTTGLFVGRRYFDTTLGYPIWLKTVSPVVWVDATGSTV